MIKRYTLPKMGRIWKDENRYQKWLDVEILSCEAWAKSAKVPKNALNIIKRKAKFSKKRIEAIEKKTNHDLLAFLENVSESLCSSAKYLHYGLTSSDVVDTALAVLMKEASEILLEDLEKLKETLKKKALFYKDTVMIGRSHGMHAEPTTLGLKFLGFSEETKRNIERMKVAKDAVSVGKLSGPVGTYSNLEPEIENYVCKKLGLKPENVSTQIIPRDRHSQFLSTLAIIASSLERLATEIRHLQRTEIGEVAEPFGKYQKGSSSMPHKHNPIICERICGLARVIRGNSFASLENISLWHERDISHSSAERVIIPDSCILLDYILNKSIKVINGLTVYPEKMKDNLNLTRGLIFSQRVLLKLMGKGMSRPAAYPIVQRIAIQTNKEKKNFQELLLKDKEARKYLTAKEISDCFNLKYYLRNIEQIFKKLR